MDRKQIEPFESWAGPLGYVLAKVSAMPDENPYANSCTWKAYEAWCAAADLLEADEWVSVEERLPDADTEFQGWFVTNDGDGFYEPRSIRNENDQIGVWGRIDYDIDGWDYELTHITLTHWRPRPTPPGGGHD